MDSIEISFSLNESGCVDPMASTASISLVSVIIFLSLGLVSFVSSGILCIGFLKFKKLREPPGDLIFGISIGDITLISHWIISSLFSRHGIVDLSNYCWFCTVNAFFSVSAGFLDYSYNICLCVYLVQSLRNALRASRIPRRSFHVVSITFALTFAISLGISGRLGKTLFGTCSYKYDSNNSGNSAYFGVFIVGLYAFISSYTYLYIKRRAPQCEKSDRAVTAFLRYYNQYIIISVFIWSGIAITNLAATIVQNNTPVDAETLLVINIIGNLCKLLTPLVLTFIRYRDKNLQFYMQKIIFFWRKEDSDIVASIDRSSIQLSLARNTLTDEPMLEPEQGESHAHRRTLTGLSGIAGKELARDLKIQITYTIISGILYTFKQVKSENTQIMSSKEFLADPDKYIIPQEYPISHSTIVSALPQLDFGGFSTLSGLIKFHSPHLFYFLIKGDAHLFDIEQSFDFGKNREAINKASGADGGKSGEFFFFSSDNNIIVKTITKMEVDELVRIMPYYADYVQSHPDSLIAKCYGVYSLRLDNFDQVEHFMIMKNVLGVPGKYVLRKYDMKGSTFDREKIKKQTISDISTLGTQGMLKDIDFLKYEKKLYVVEEMTKQIIAAAARDANFFMRYNLMDYSLAVFVVDRKRYMDENNGKLPQEMQDRPWRSLESEKYPGLSYHIGVIDYLQPYNFNKMVERNLKRIMTLNYRLDTSSQPSDRYAARFIEYMKKIVGPLDPSEAIYPKEFASTI